jgi:hypothetical protein
MHTEYLAQQAEEFFECGVGLCFLNFRHAILECARRHIETQLFLVIRLIIAQIIWLIVAARCYLPNT